MHLIITEIKQIDKFYDQKYICLIVSLFYCSFHIVIEIA